MTIVSQERSASLLEEVFDGDDVWVNPQLAILIDNGYADSTVASGDTSNSLRWSDFGFSFDYFATLIGVEVTHAIIAPLFIAGSHRVENRFDNDLGIMTLNPVTGVPTSGSSVETVLGSPTDTFLIDSSPFYQGISTINGSDFTVRQAVKKNSGFGGTTFSHYGLKLKIYVNEPDNIVLSSDAEAVRLGDSKISSFRDNGVNYLSIRLASNFTTRSNSNFVLGGMPFSAYEDYLGNRAIAIYDASNSSLGSSWNISENNYVYKGFRYSFLENDQYRLFRCGFGSESAVITSSHTVWQGVPISLDSSGHVIGKMLTGNIDEIRSFTLGGTPLTAVRIGNDWAIAAGSV